MVYNTFYPLGNSTFIIMLKWLEVTVVNYFLLFLEFLYSLKLVTIAKAGRRGGTFAFLLPPDGNIVKRLRFNKLRYKSFKKALVVLDLIPSLEEVISFRFVMYLRLTVLRRLYVFSDMIVKMMPGWLSFVNICLFM